MQKRLAVFRTTIFLRTTSKLDITVFGTSISFELLPHR